ncbi:hypothetical protein [Kitasatospora terrestris]
MLDSVDGDGSRARGLHPGEPIPFGLQPVLVSPTTVYGTVLVETILRGWPPAGLPRPWLVLLADIPAKPASAARYRLRVLSSRLAGTVALPYLPALRAVERPEDALNDPTVARAAAQLRRQLEGP